MLECLNACPNEIVQAGLNDCLNKLVWAGENA